MADLQIFKGMVETGDPDPRQERFRAAMVAIDAENESPVDWIAMQGFRASHIDLGWISAKILRYVILEPVSAGELAQLLGQELPLIIQRLKGYSIDTDDWPHTIEIALETKDDHGTYHYRFTAPVD